MLQSHRHGQFFRPLDPILFSATMVRCRSVSLPSVFPRPRSRRQDLKGRPLSSPVWPLPDRSASPYLSRLGWPLRFHWGIKKGNPPAVLLLPSLAKFRARQCRRSCFPLRLVFGHPATSPSMSLLRPVTEQAASLSSLTTSRRSSEEDWEKNPSLHRQPCLSSWRRSSPSTGRL
jgi:hypothetical protein